MAERKSFLLRIDPRLWAELEGWAQAELRSVNGQIEYLLREAVERRRSRSRAARGSGAGSGVRGSESRAAEEPPRDGEDARPQI